MTVLSSFTLISVVVDEPTTRDLNSIDCILVRGGHWAAGLLCVNACSSMRVTYNTGPVMRAE